MFLIAGSLLVIVLTGSMFVICPSAQYSCQVTQAVSLVFGLIGLVFLLVGGSRSKRTRPSRTGRRERLYGRTAGHSTASCGAYSAGVIGALAEWVLLTREKPVVGIPALIAAYARDGCGGAVTAALFVQDAFGAGHLAPVGQQ